MIWRIYYAAIFCVSYVGRIFASHALTHQASAIGDAEYPKGRNTEKIGRRSGYCRLPFSPAVKKRLACHSPPFVTGMIGAAKRAM